MNAPPSSPSPAARESVAPKKPVTLELLLEAVHDVRDDVESVRTDFDGLRADFAALKKRVDGSNPPGPNGEPVAVQAARGSKASFDVEEIRGELMAVRAELGKQSTAMGLTQQGFAWLWSKDGRTAMVRLGTLAGSAYAALHAMGWLR